jgi:hypothetical protein
LGVKLGRGGGEVFEEGRAEPAFDAALGPGIPCAFVFIAAADEAGLVAGEWLSGEGEAEALRCVWDVGGEEVEDGVGTGDEGLADEADAVVVEDPRAFESIGSDGEEGVHAIIGVAAPLCRGERPGTRRQSAVATAEED